MTILISLYLFALGLACGSFFNVVGLRVPAGQSILRPPSACPHCGHRLRARELIPVLSYALSRGRCRSCAAGVSPLYPAGELAAALLFVWAYLRFGLTVQAWIGLLLASLTVIITVSDIRYMRIPNAVLLAFLPMLLALRLLNPDGRSYIEYFAGAAIGGGVLLAISLLSRGGVGMGDVKLLALFGLVLGWKGVLLALMLGSLAGTIGGLLLVLIRKGKAKEPIPFGPYLSLGALIAYGYGDAIIDGYLNLFK
ncbi:prepilin peptidase [Paenibacillus pasadenensis]|uniref:prepilin peptidase n=1 Tax=Paenibacillus pasadenensis TaxID=217090 RepID=UPI00203D3FDD|nr:A24 family peptidase [Paenibacillus pasadenensis]MCM3750068.1 prepilin peptidase [Paenibacillus pasadenensis]